MWNRSKLYAVSLLVAVFAAGAAVGGGASAAWGDRAREGASPRSDRRDRDYVGHLQEELGLSAAQRDSLDRILATYQEAMGDLWRDARTRMQSIRSDVRRDITTMLDEEQQRLYEVHNARVDSARAERGRNGRRERDDDDR